MEEKHIQLIASELSLNQNQVRAVAELLADNATVPFIARYRKEATGSLDEVAVTSIRDRLAQLEELDKRRESILKSLAERELLTDDLKEQIMAVDSMTSLEDVYLPYRPKRRTRATIAVEKGLEPLAKILLAQDPAIVPLDEAAGYADPGKGVETAEQALEGARDIMAEWVSHDQEARPRIRNLFEQKGVVKSTVIKDMEEKGAKFRDYFDWEEPVAAAPSHRVLAIRRGEAEGFLKMRMAPPEEEALALLEDLFVKGECPASEQVREALSAGYKRLLSPSMETELRLITKERADREAIRVFSNNLRELLLSPPLGQKNILAIDPGFRTGCKVVCLDSQGALLNTAVIQPFQSEKVKSASADKVRELCARYEVEAIAVGNGTAGRETESFIKSLSLHGNVLVVMVNESGASIYSASEAARAEFPDLDLTYRGAISIGRRLMDPLAELVKIDPKSIGVGQYQHDVNQRDLKEKLDDVVMSCVNGVGVEVNTASEQLLTYVSGLGPQLAKNILAYRTENGPFKSRAALKKVPRMGPKAFEQATGFLRVRNGKNPLDASAVHPESYPIVKTMVKDLDCTVVDLMKSEELRKKIQLGEYVTVDVGLPTLDDIMSELAKPGRDPRNQFSSWDFAEGVEQIEDLEPGMQVPGIVTNVTAFGAFVDVGVHQDGLVHISQLADRFVKDPHEVAAVQQKVIVTVLEIDLPRKRISLSMKKNPEKGRQGSGKTAGQANQQKRRQGQKKRSEPAPFNAGLANAFKKTRPSN
ncbi:MAG: RNA-binding transcriptional accessory protein [Deltaproteobacteria bacterium]|nr:RNA-binding transcriptional accessory protein [Deltaproteobacteria bacterium]